MDLYPRSVSHPSGEIQYGVTTDGGDVTAFVVQLRCWVGIGTELVAQFDHTPEEGSGHDVEREGIHMDVFRDGEKVDTSEVAEAGFDSHPGRLPAAAALNYALRYIEEQNERLIERYTTWQNE
jgi:hypothetical protein